MTQANSPSLTYQRCELLANIVLFVPMGVLLAMSLSARLRYLVLPIGFVVSVFIKGMAGAAVADSFAQPVQQSSPTRPEPAWA